MNRTKMMATALTVALFAAACSGGDDESADTTTAETTAAPTTEATTTTTEATTTTTEPATTTSTTVPDVLRMPLTGAPIADEAEIPDRPALIVKITNAGPTATPQAGLNSADIVIEEIINDSVTRLAAVFHSDEADPVGPIRSGRAQDVNILRMFQQPLFAWSGGNASVTRAIRESDMINIDARYEPGFYRRSGRRAPNDLYSSTEVLWDQTTEEAGRPVTVFPYLGLDEAPTGDPATEIEIALDSIDAVWTYDPESGRYFRDQNGQAHNTETADDVEQIWADNVVVLLADYGVNVFDGNPDAQTQGSNPVYVFSGGTVSEGVWLRFAPTDPIGLFDNVDDLNEIGLQPGRTWLEIPRNDDDVVSWS
ncbi:MAG: hypothetical protein CL424_08265 [Acidimicrobiaceae bacterium]|nr:hypothetical protein [Acidimicrobiaceae bacterium]